MDIEQQLRIALAPANPAPRVRAAVMTRLAAGPGRSFPKRWAFAGLALALGAAAAMLANRWRDAPGHASVGDAGPEAIESRSVGPIAKALPEVAVAPVPAAPASAAEPKMPATKPFTVLVMPLKSDVADPARKAAIESVYALLVSGLRSVPNAIVLEAPVTGEAPPAASDYRLTLTGVANPTTNRDAYVLRLEAMVFRDQRRQGALHTSIPGTTSPGCETPASTDVLSKLSECADPSGLAALMLSTLRKSVFPPDPQLQRRLEDRLADLKLDSTDRLRALADLASLGRSGGFMSPGDFPAALHDPAVVRAAIQLASSAPDAATRAQVWNTLRGSTDPQLVSPLVVALRADPDDDTRVQALAVLADGYATDASARAALEAAAAEDPKPMVRALAKRALGAEAAWTEHVLSSLKNAELPALERIEAFFYAYGLQTTRDYGRYSAEGRVLRALDDAGIRALAEVIPEAARGSAAYMRASHTLMSEFAQLKHPAVTDLLLRELTASDSWYDPSWAIDGLRSRTDDLRVRAALQKIADESPRPQLKALAADVLGGAPRQLPGDQSGVASDPTKAPPRLGVASDYVKAGPDVPADLVGRLVVTNMVTGAPADQAGIREGDILLEVGGKAITSGPQLLEVLDIQPRNQDVEVLISRNGQVMRRVVQF